VERLFFHHHFFVPPRRRKHTQLAPHALRIRNDLCVSLTVPRRLGQCDLVRCGADFEVVSDGAGPDFAAQPGRDAAPPHLSVCGAELRVEHLCGPVGEEKRGPVFCFYARGFFAGEGFVFEALGFEAVCGLCVSYKNGVWEERSDAPASSMRASIFWYSLRCFFSSFGFFGGSHEGRVRERYFCFSTDGWKGSMRGSLLRTGGREDFLVLGSGWFRDGERVRPGCWRLTSCFFSNSD
jgi:hypothetical protein